MPNQVLERPAPSKTSTEQGPCILIVDDDESMVEVLTCRLSKLGYRTIAAETGQQAMSTARDQQPDLILLDLRLPDVDGFSVCRELVDDPETCAIPVIILSGMERPDIIRSSRAAGCQYYVRKPYDPNALLILIRQAIVEASQWQECEDE